MQELMTAGVALRHQGANTFTRRRLLRTAFWSGVLGGGAGAVVGLCRSFRAPAASGVVRVPPELLPAASGPPRAVPAAHFAVVHLAPGERLEGGRYQPPGETPGGFLVLSTRDSWTPCPRRGVAWDPFFRENGAFLDPCRHAAFNRAGLPFYGPAFRPLATLGVSFDAAGGLLVDTGDIRPGSEDNPLRTVRP
jgi:hypothetical protein